MNERPRLILVTGAAGDLGAAAVRAALTDGIRVVATDRDAAGLARLADVPGLTRCVLDVTSAEQWADVADRVAGLGKLDGFFNNAGIVGPTASIESTPDEDFDATIAVNVRGTYLGLKHVTPLLRDGAAIVNTSSVAGVIGFPNRVAYVAAKHAVIGMTRALALELARRRIRVNAIAPGPLAGRMMDSLEEAGGDGAHGHIRGRIPLGDYGRVDDVAQLVLFLLSERAAYLTGSVVNADGGITAGRL